MAKDVETPDNWYIQQNQEPRKKIIACVAKELILEGKRPTCRRIASADYLEDLRTEKLAEEFDIPEIDAFKIYETVLSQIKDSHLAKKEEGHDCWDVYVEEENKSEHSIHFLNGSRRSSGSGGSRLSRHLKMGHFGKK